MNQKKRWTLVSICNSEEACLAVTCVSKIRFSFFSNVSSNDESTRETAEQKDTKKTLILKESKQ
jgi:hypothetical protein